MKAREVKSRLRPSRVAPFTANNRIVPTFQNTPPFASPADIRHIFKQPTGRSTGGAVFQEGYAGAPYEAMDWIYTVGGDFIYEQLLSIYWPHAPWVWVYYYDPIEDDGIWVEAVLLEPHIERGVGKTITGITLSFRHMVRGLV